MPARVGTTGTARLPSGPRRPPAGLRTASRLGVGFVRRINALRLVHVLRLVIAVVWILFWVYWFASAVSAKQRAVGSRRWSLGGVTALGIVIMLRVFRSGSLEVHSPVLGTIGAVLVAAGLGLAVWARIHLGRNWGMPMSQKAEPELVTSGPYRLVRHPIYSGLLLATFGTALVTNLIGLIIAAVVVGYFCYAATVEERNLTAIFPSMYPAYKDSTKMLIPFLL